MKSPFATLVVTLHEGHGKMFSQDTTNARKTQINYMIKSLKDKALERRKEVEQFNQRRMEVQAQVRPNDCNHRSEETRCFRCDR